MNALTLFDTKIRETVATLTMLETPGKLNRPLDLLMVPSRPSQQPAHPMPTSLSTCAKILLSMEPLVWLGLAQSVDPDQAGKVTKLPSMKGEKVLCQLLR